jgi:hypothetical protein
LGATSPYRLPAAKTKMIFTRTGEVINIDTGEVLMSVIKTDFLRYAELSVVEPDGGLFATFNGHTRLVDVTNL